MKVPLGHRLAYLCFATLIVPTGLMVIMVNSPIAQGALNRQPRMQQQDFSNLHITEVMHDPVKSENFSGGQHEFVELHNQGTTALIMDGVSFSDGISLTLPSDLRLEVDAYFVVAKNPAAFAERYGTPPDNTIGYSGQLQNSGERIALLDSSGSEILALTFSSDAPHLQLAGGGGFSLVPVDAATIPMTTDDWRISAELYGSPGRVDQPPVQSGPAPIKVNEVLAHTDLPQIDFIELYNPTAETANISDWYITDNLGDPKRFRVPFGTEILPNDYLVFDETQLGFAFFSEGDGAFLLSGDVAGNLTGYSHGFDFGVSPNGASWGRCTAPADGNALIEHFLLQESISDGAPNGLPAVSSAVISEFLYAPANGDEFVELANRTAEDVPLYDPEHPESLWRINGIGAFTFTVNTTIPANGTLLVTSIDPALFRTRYSIPANIPIQGPFDGQLSDNGERLTLQQPDNPNLNGTIPYMDVDSVDYAAAAPWPIVITTNQSLERIALDEFGDSPLNWRASPAAGGTPGSPPTAIGAAAPMWRAANVSPAAVDSVFLPFVAAQRLVATDSCFRILGR